MMAETRPTVMAYQEQGEDAGRFGDDYYQPGDPRTFGNPPRPLTDEEVDAWAQAHSGLSLPAAEDIAHRAIAAFWHDRFRSALPTLKEGAKFVRSVLPLMLREYGVGQVSGLEEPVMVYDRILAGLWEGNDRAVAGGLETNYVFMNKAPEAQSYEYLGEALGRSVRAALVPGADLSLKTQAFFGWIGRHVMKKVWPAIDFSLDRHEGRVAKEREELVVRFKWLEQEVGKGLEGPLTPEKVYQFFNDLTYGHIPSISMAETPLQYRLATDVFGYGLDLPTHVSSSNNFPQFVEDWQKVVVAVRHERRALPWEIWGDNAYGRYLAELSRKIKESGFLYKETRQYFRGLFKAYGCSRVSQLPKEVIEEWYRTEARKEELLGAKRILDGWRRLPEDIFGGLLASPEAMAGATQDQLLRAWFKMHQKSFLKTLSEAQEETLIFQTSYFRFIKGPAAEGYAFAQQHIAEVLADLPAVVRLPEAEIKTRFMSGEAKILNPHGDFGQNSAEDGDDELRRDLFLVNALKPKTDADRVWMWEIRDGENARIWEELMSLAMTEEQKILGAAPLFFGFEYTDRLAAAYLAGEMEQFGQGEARKSRYEQSIGRIKELEAGEFKLPQTWGEVLQNADLQIKRIQDPRRNKAVNEIRGLIREAAKRGIITAVKD